MSKDKKTIKKTSKQSSTKLKSITKLVIYLVLFLLFSLLFYFVTYLFFSKTKKDKNTFVINYTNDMNLNYKVCVHKNPYYLEDCIAMDKQYPYSIINKIKYNITDNLEASKNMEVKYTYVVTANLVSETISKEAPKEELWNKEYILIPEVSKTINSNRISINLDFEIDYSLYEEIMEKYRQTFQVPMDAYLKIQYNLKLDNEQENVHEQIYASSNIPLLEPVVKIKNVVPNKINKDVFVDKRNIYKYTHLIILDTILLILNILLIIKGSKLQFAVNLDAKVKKIIKLYSEDIIVVNKLPSKKRLEIINVKSINDLLDLEQSLKIPIMYFNKDEETKIFAIFSDKYLYQKIITIDNVKSIGDKS